MVPPQHMMFLEVSTREPAKGHEFRMPTIDASGALGTKSFAKLGLSPRSAGRILEGLHDYCFSPSSAKLVIYVLFFPQQCFLHRPQSALAGRTPQTRRASRSSRLDDRDVLLPHVFLHFDLDRAFPFLLRISKLLVEPGIVPA